MADLRDVVIIGGGPAGLAAANVLARNGLSVAVCERESLPRDKVCGEGVMPTGLAHLASLGASEHLDVKECRPFVGIRFHSRGGAVAAARFPEGPGWGIRRTNLSRALLAAARKWPGFELRTDCTLRGLEATAEGYLVKLTDGELRCRLLVGADGLGSMVRRLTGLERRLPQLLQRRMGARQHFQVAPWSSYVEVFLGVGIEAYITPCAEDFSGVAFLWNRVRYPHFRGGREMIPSLLAAFPQLRRRFEGAAPCSAPGAMGPLRRVARRRAGDGVLLIGDAGGYLDACTGEGISLALAQALALETTVVPLLAPGRPRPARRELAAYEAACRAILRPYYFGTHMQLLLCRRPWVGDRVVRTLAAHPEAMSQLLSANMGNAPFWPGWRNAGRLLWTFCLGGGPTTQARRASEGYSDAQASDT